MAAERPPADASETMPPMKVAVIDVGSNSVRLLVASVTRTGEIEQLRRERAYLRLGDDAYAQGRIGDSKLEQAALVSRRFARSARKRGAERLATIVTAPGRQAANGDELLAAIAEATEAPVELLSAEEEGRLAWEGCVAGIRDTVGAVAVIDLGGGSCEVAVGMPGEGVEWIRSHDAGALRVTRAFLDVATPTVDEARRARDGVRALLADLDSPHAEHAFAVGGTARALGRLLGPRFDADDLDQLASRLVRDGVERTIAGTSITPQRGETLLGGTLVLAELADRLGRPLRVGRGGLREGAALALADADALAA
ncbi:MAG: exopolyphosphatase [Gaiellaceae bacterium]|nr:MAG: exopolyphosphatase [Gaiellaceae bacterium]